jgi:hypothetical protein
MTNWIQTYTGKQFRMLDPDIRALDVIDIAHALSMQCRYTGHTSRFYSVAEHSVRVSREVERALEPLNWTEEAKLMTTKWALIHDASEAYLGDMSLPLKREPAMVAYRVAESVLQLRICAWLGLPPEEPVVVKTTDMGILGLEFRQLMSHIDPEFAKSLPDPFPGHHELGWTPAVAKRNFLQRFRRLWGSVGDYTDTDGEVR